ncbi:hypothetical protein MTO96_038336 [Rhipicephalus appendiculatus]
MYWQICISLLCLVFVPCEMRNPICFLPKDIRKCAIWDFAQRWYFDPGMSACRQNLYGGCGGNANRFDTCEQCSQACETDVCAKGGRPGPVLGRRGKHNKKRRQYTRRHQFQFVLPARYYDSGSFEY